MLFSKAEVALAASIPLPFTRAKTYKLNADRPAAAIPPTFFEAPEKVIYPVHNGGRATALPRSLGRAASRNE